MFKQTARSKLNFFVLIPDEERKLPQIFIFTFLCGASKVRPERITKKTSQRNVKIKNYVNFHFNSAF